MGSECSWLQFAPRPVGGAGETRGTQERPRRLQEGLKRPQEPVKRALQLQRCPAKMPCHCMQDGHAKKWRAGGGLAPKGQGNPPPGPQGRDERRVGLEESKGISIIVEALYV